MIRLLQICNVGSIVGGTAACAWTVTRALPDCEHIVAFLGRIAPETRSAFSGCTLLQWDRATGERVAAASADVVLLHNTSRGRVDLPLPVIAIHYLHSRMSPLPVDRVLYCSHWLAQLCRTDKKHVCWQAVPQPPRPDSRSSIAHDTRSLREHPVVGRICTPQARKWPANTAELYSTLAARFPHVAWEFVGSPASLQPSLQHACRGRAEFFPAGWQMRSRFWHWDALLYHNPHLPESFGRTVAEAMRAGCIPIVDRLGGFIEQLPEQSGYLCSTEPQFIDAVARLHSPGERLRRSRACRAHADEHFSLGRFRSDLLGRIREAVAAALSR